MTEIVNPLIINEIRVLWSDYLHEMNPGTFCNQMFRDFSFVDFGHILVVLYSDQSEKVSLKESSIHIDFMVF